MFGSSRYLAIVKDEQLEISQPALDPDKSEVHHQITARERGSNVHRLSYDSCPKGGAMSKLFYVTLIHALRSILSAGGFTSPVMVQLYVMETVQHLRALVLFFSLFLDTFVTFLPCYFDRVIGPQILELWTQSTLSIMPCLHSETKSRTVGIGRYFKEGQPRETQLSSVTFMGFHALRKPHEINRRAEVRRQSYKDFMEFKTRWRKAAESDECWIDPYPQPAKQNVT
ncbi:hypothetical protein RHGRI_027180 [Rhododendron griersonianum]|uniref:Uncharacterized protein n=1 Tax=Rhododendron griersonianum TaxID=479676 RepID=A0AAV6J165_9ERIC|nr:hypothetical protein RHGRI_027180 [Rhododendron griersonianum]